MFSLSFDLKCQPLAAHSKVIYIMTAHRNDFKDNVAVVRAVAVDFVDRYPSKANSAKRAVVYNAVGKRALDVLLILLAFPVVVPVVAILAMFVATDGNNPFYRQKRIGRFGRVYSMWKLRSMVVDADKKLAAYLDENPAAKSEWEATQKLKNDPRITKVGRLIRKTSLDELPQLWNVFIGDMSLVGPRPMMVDQKSLYPGKDYYRLRPGITGSWQVSARNESTFAERAIFDSSYHSSLSLKTDVAILLKTVKVVVRATGH